MGGGSSRNWIVIILLSDIEKSDIALRINQIVKNSPTYWGNQPFVEAPAYVGIAVFFCLSFQFFV